MSLRPRRGLAPLLALTALALAAPARAGGVEDRAGLFQPGTIDKADAAIEEIRRRTHKDVLVETVRKLPEKRLEEYRRLKTGGERAEFFTKLAEEYASHSGVDGVYVLLCRVPAVEEGRPGLLRGWTKKVSDLVIPPRAVGHAVVVWPPDNDRYFSADDRAALDAKFGDAKAVAAPEKKYDETLLAAVELTGARLEANARANGAPPADPFRWTEVVWAAAALLAAWAVAALFRARAAARRGGAAPAPGVNRGPSVLLGAAGGLWLYEAYLAARRAAAAAPPPAETVAETEGPAPPPADVPAEGGVHHPDDLAAMTGATDLWAETEAPTGHDPA